MAEWRGFGDFLGTGRIADRLRVFRSFKEAKVYARSLKLKNVSDWYKLSKKRILSKDIPLNAERVYKNKGWKGWGDFLGTGTIATKFRNFLPFKKARTYVRSLKLKSGKEFIKLARLEKLPKNIPFHPHRVYKNKGWTSFGDFLGKELFIPYKLRKYRPFIKARKHVHSLKLKNHKEWYKFYKSRKLPKDIPLDAAKFYKNKGWKGWGDFLGTGYIASKLRNYCSFAKAKAYVHRLKLKSSREFNEYKKTGKLPKDISTSPASTYKNKGWKGWENFLGTG